MKLPAVLLVGTLALNAALFATLTLRTSAPASSRPAGHAAGVATGSSPADQVAGKTTLAASQPDKEPGAGDWASFDTTDLHELAAKLRAAGFPDAIVRAVIASRAESLFAPRMKELFASVANLPVWQQDPRISMDAKIMEGRNQIMRERTRMIRDALGTTGGDSEAARRRQFGDLPEGKIDLVQRISEDYAEMMSQVRAGTHGIMLPEDRDKLALLERERKADLVAILSPEEMQAYEMRTSQVTNRLRAALTVMDATEEEFRTIFHIYEPFNDRINPNVGPGAVALPANFGNDRRAATTEMMAQMKSALPPDRYAEFERAQDREYQVLDALARQNSLPKESAINAFALRDRYSAETTRLADDRSMPADQKTAALQSLVADARAQITNTLGPKVGADYIQSANWLNVMEQGRAFTIMPGGGMSMRPISMPSPPPRK